MLTEWNVNHGVPLLVHEGLTRNLDLAKLDRFVFPIKDGNGISSIQHTKTEQGLIKKCK